MFYLVSASIPTKAAATRRLPHVHVTPASFTTFYLVLKYRLCITFAICSEELLKANVIGTYMEIHLNVYCSSYNGRQGLDCRKSNETEVL